MVALERGATPETRKARTVAKTMRDLTKLSSSNSDNANSILAIRLQFLTRHGVSQSRAGLLAALYFGDAA